MPDPETQPSPAELIADGVEVDWNRQASSGRFSLEELQRFQSIERVVLTHQQLFKESPESLTWGLNVSTQAIARPTALPVSGDRAQPGTKWGHLEIREHVDGGGFGDVYRAFDTVLEMEVALKLMRDKGHAPDDNMRRFLAEARRLARVRHDNVVILHGADVRDGRMGMWTDFLQGTTLEVQLSIQGPMSAREAALVGIDLCRALAAVHGAGLVHRDVKTSNVMRTEGGRIILFDFGLAATDRRGNPNEPLASLGGTPLYMAPEVLRGAQPDASADLYALGVLLFRLVTNRYPIEARAIKDILDMHQVGRRTPLRSLRPDLPTEFVSIVEKAIAPLPEDRYPDAASLEMALAGFVGSLEHAERHWYLRPASLIAGGTVAAIAAIALIVVAAIPPFSVDASLYNGTTELFSGDKVRPGDSITLKLHASRTTRIVVLNRDAEGHLQRLFPESGEAAAAVLAGGDHVLPEGTTEVEHFWKVTSVAGVESFVVIAAGSPRWLPWKAPALPQDLETALAEVPLPEDESLLAAITVPEPGEKTRAELGARRRASQPAGMLEYLVEEGAAHKLRVQRFDLNIEDTQP